MGAADFTWATSAEIAHAVGAGQRRQGGADRVQRLDVFRVRITQSQPQQLETGPVLEQQPPSAFQAERAGPGTSLGVHMRRSDGGMFTAGPR